MLTRKRIKASEKQVASMWQQLLGKELTTEEGGRVRIIYLGRINGDSGPDFRDAIIVMNESNLMKGDVEIHAKSSDWHNHGHHRDAGYNGVILHVVGRHNCNSVTLAQNGKSIPVLCLAEGLWHRVHTTSYYQLPCSRIMRRMDKQTLKKLLDVAGEERFKQKAALFQASLRGEDAGQALFRSIMRALGYSKNMKPFEELAYRARLGFMEKMEPKESLLLKQAWLLGIAGLLPSQRLGGEFSIRREVRDLEQTWQSVAEETKTMREGDWHFSHVYPNNSPVRRIVAQSYLLQRYYENGLLMGILRLVEESPLIAGNRRLENGLVVLGDDYWQDHFDFAVASKTRKSALLGRSKAGEIIINVVLPFAFSWGEIADEPELKRKAIELYLHYPKLSENEITRHMVRQLCLEGSCDFTACHQQGLIHIFRNYCREGKCSECPLA
jgi:hypothetical protein